ncbi:MAG TPA: Holliday junction resolvase RuvX, partial [Pyrinomonadaceae bacterium]|nr:Holliday junction resolvase RuvX [Pyrinomonadaceae bacterium]
PGLRMTTPENVPEEKGRILALDLGQKRVGVAICDELLISITRLNPILRTNWKHLLANVAQLIQQHDVKTLVIGLPLSLDGTTASAAVATSQTAGNFARSLSIPVFLQDERLTSVAAAEQLREAGHNPTEVEQLIDSEAAAIILADFLGSQTKTLVSPGESD